MNTIDPKLKSESTVDPKLRSEPAMDQIIKVSDILPLYGYVQKPSKTTPKIQNETGRCIRINDKFSVLKIKDTEIDCLEVLCDIPYYRLFDSVYILIQPAKFGIFEKYTIWDNERPKDQIIYLTDTEFFVNQKGERVKIKIDQEQDMIYEKLPIDKSYKDVLDILNIKEEKAPKTETRKDKEKPQKLVKPEDIRWKKINMKVKYGIEDFRQQLEDPISVHIMLSHFSRVFGFLTPSGTAGLAVVKDTRQGIQKLTGTNTEKFLRGIRYLDDHSVRRSIINHVLDNAHNIRYDGIRFCSDDRNYISTFMGWKHFVDDFKLDEGAVNIIKPFLDFMKEVICSGVEERFDYLVQWIGSILKKPGYKTQVMIQLLGTTGIGKTVFTDVISELFAGYSRPNINKVEQVTGKFNAGLENVVFAVLSEIQDSDNRRIDHNSLKSIITERFIDAEKKGVDAAQIEIPINLLYVSNYVSPYMETEQRRYTIFNVSSAKQNDREFFKNLIKTTYDENFYTVLTHWFIENVDDPTTPMFPLETDESENLRDVSITLVDKYICKNLTKLIHGILRIEEFKPTFKDDLIRLGMSEIEATDRKVKVLANELSARCKIKSQSRRSVNKTQRYTYQIEDSWVKKYMKEPYLQYVNDPDGVIEIKKELFTEEEIENIRENYD